MLLIIFTWLITTVVYVALVWIGLRRVVRHLKANDSGMKAIVEHLLIPLLGKEKPPEEEPKPAKDDGKKKGILV